MLHPNFQIKKSERICSRANDPNADLEIWHYRVDEHVCIHYLKKKLFLRKKIPPKGQFLFKNNQKKEVKKETTQNQKKHTNNTTIHKHYQKNPCLSQRIALLVRLCFADFVCSPASLSCITSHTSGIFETRSLTFTAWRWKLVDPRLHPRVH